MNTNIANRQLFVPAARRGLRRTVLAALAVVGAIAGFVTGAQANSFTDGGFGSFGGSTGTCSGGGITQQVTNASGDLPGWTVNSDYTFVLNTGNYQSFANVYNNSGCIGLQAPKSLQPAISPIPVGTNFLAIDPSYENGTGWSLAQVITNLIAGATYTISFDMAAGQQTGYHGDTTDTWLVGLGATAGTGNSASSSPISLPDTCDPNPGNCGGGFSGWVGQTISLVATAMTETLWFFGESTAGQAQPPFLLLDGVSLTTNTSVPEPPAIGVLLVGLLGLLGVRRVYRTKKAKAA
jgi:hypothetical protein